MSDPYLLSSYQYELPQELIAQKPCHPRDHSRLMILNRHNGSIQEGVFKEIENLLSPEDRLIFNNTKVIPARLIGKKSTGAKVEIFLNKPLNADSFIWEAIVRPGRKLKTGSRVDFGEDFYAEILESTADGGRIVKFFCDGDFEQLLQKYGQMPLPHYIERDQPLSLDKSCYQTIYAKNPGAVAAPTAGLHFTSELLQKLEKKMIHQTWITLHVGLGTFRPVKTEDIREHHMHHERLMITSQAAEEINSTKGRKIAIGTTGCRTLESASSNGLIIPGSFETNLFIYPGYKFKSVQGLLTNFHLPGSSLMMLVSAFAGREFIMEAYAKAIERKFRFFSYGDAMLIL